MKIIIKNYIKIWIHNGVVKNYKKLSNIILNTIYPPKCIACNNYVDEPYNLCHACWNKIEFITQPACKICSIPFVVEYLSGNCIDCDTLKPKYDKNLSVFKYNKFTKKLISDFKFNDKTEYAKSFAKLIYKVGYKLIDKCDYVIAVPMHKTSLKIRKYNPAQLIAKKIIKLSNKPVLHNCLIKVKFTQSQSSLKRKARLKNLIDVFAINESKINLLIGKNVMLVDDVMTTGATINECARILKKAGVKRVYVITLARTY